MVEPTISLEQFDNEPSEGRSHSGCAACGTGRWLADASHSGNDLEKACPTTAVRFGYIRYIGEFTHPPDLRFTCGARLVIQTQRGIELGEQVSLTCAGCDKSVTPEQLKEWVEHSGEDTYIFSAGRILREATAADLAEFARIQSSCRQKRDFAQQAAERQKLPLKVVECECPLGGERIIFYFTAAERVDFRALVKDLAKEYRTRIEMRQIGARDEARLLADYETCGREVCCKVFLKTLKPISMRMAKLQKATLDPTQVSGRCGRLKCCLRYEHTSYEELDKRLPRTGVRIRTNHGEGVVVNRQVLTQLVQIRTDSDTLASVVVEDITAVDVEAPTRESEQVGPVPSEKAPKHRTSARVPTPVKKPAKPRRKPSAPRERPEKMRSEPRIAGTGETGPGKPKTAEQPARRRRRRRRRRRTDGKSGGSSGGSPNPREG
ncbi:MAG: hypothetical protein JSU86_18980 [Phycisphaerales bacterium]|nr:MAG: hypothetical protein JSU86_18980 [Phycisphaerales bacterium]